MPKLYKGGRTERLGFSFTPETKQKLNTLRDLAGESEADYFTRLVDQDYRNHFERPIVRPNKRLNFFMQVGSARWRIIAILWIVAFATVYRFR